jgi:predicted RNA-binding Zn ribbon-like protein
MSNDWRNGFLFVGNHLALDFLNTRPVLEGHEVEMMPNGEALAKWMSAAGLLKPSEAVRLGRHWQGPRSAATLKELRRIREDLRKAVFQMEDKGSAPGGFVNDLNQLLRTHPVLEHVVRGSPGWERSKKFDIEAPDDAFAPLADAIADLVTHADLSRLRKCRACVLHFYDTSKKGTRIWCSMNICGNRAKVAAFAERKRSAEDQEYWLP